MAIKPKIDLKIYNEIINDESNFVKHYNDTFDHIRAVQKLCGILGRGNERSVLRHDLDKIWGDYSDDYVIFAYLGRNANLYDPELFTDEVRKIVLSAIYSHISNNPHHPEFWNKSTFTLKDFLERKSMLMNKMPNEYIIEMVCDWSAVHLYLYSHLEKLVSEFMKINVGIGKRYGFDINQVALINKTIKELNKKLELE